MRPSNTSNAAIKSYLGPIESCLRLPNNPTSTWSNAYTKSTPSILPEERPVLSPLALISSLLSFLQLLQSCGQTLLGTIQLLLNQLDTSVQRGDISFSLGEGVKSRIGDPEGLACRTFQAERLEPRCYQAQIGLAWDTWTELHVI